MKKKQLVGVALAALTALSLIGCGGNSASSTPAASEKAPVEAAASAAKDSIKIAAARDINALDGFTGNNTAYGLAYSIFDTLVCLNPDSTIRENLATEWEQVDDYTWRFKLREGVKFTNGEDFNAESAAYSINYMASLDTNYQNYKQWGQSWPPAAEVESEYTILIKTQAPNLAVPNLLTRGAMLPMEASQKEEFWTNPIGTGAYKLESWNVGVQIVVTANEDYWGGAPEIKTLTYDIMKDTTARAAAVKSGEYDYVESVPFDAALDLKANPTSQMELVRTDQTGMWYVYFNGYSTNSFIQNPEFRQALLYAIDHKGICEAIMGGLANAAESLTPMYIDGVYETEGFPERDKDKAMELAKALGYNGETIRIARGGTQFNNDVEVLELIMAQLMEAGFNVEYKEYDSATWSSQYKKTDCYDICVNGYGGTYTGDSEQYYTQGVKNLGWKFEACETLLGEIYGEGITEEQRSADLSAMMQECWEQTPYLWACESCGLWAINPNLQGYEILPHGQYNFIKASFK